MTLSNAARDIASAPSADPRCPGRNLPGPLYRGSSGWLFHATGLSPSGHVQKPMTDKPVELDGHRGISAQKATEIRRRLHEVQADQAALRSRQQEFERYAIAAPSTTWSEAATKARYLIQLFAATPDARDPRRQEMLAKGLDHLARLSD